MLTHAHCPTEPISTRSSDLGTLALDFVERFHNSWLFDPRRTAMSEYKKPHYQGIKTSYGGTTNITFEINAKYWLEN
jgi:hypothetical protein